MKATYKALLVALPLALLLAVVPGSASAARNDDRFVTGPASGSAVDIAVGYLDAHKAELSLTAADVADFAVSDAYRSAHNGVTHVYLQQRLGGIEVVNGIFNVNVMSDGRIVNFGNRFVANLAGNASALSPQIEHEDAIASAADHLGLSLDRSGLRFIEVFGGPALEIRYNGAGISGDPIPVKLAYLPRDSGGTSLTWSVVIRRTDNPDWLNLFVDAVSGEVLEVFNWTAHQKGAENTVQSSAPSGASDLVGATTGGGCAGSACYEVFATPKESPDDGARSDDIDPADVIASPFGWHDTNGAAGAEFTDSRGNNVEAQTDLDANNTFTAGTDVRSEGGASLDFDEPLDLAFGPETYLEFAVLNLFYWNNIMHDITYQYGFDEASGNFQTNNYGNGGAGGDPVQADAQDGSDTDNANFGTPPDGFDPRMQMFIWTNPFAQFVTVNSPGSIADSYVANPSNNGGTGMGLTADLALVEDGVAPTTDACETVTNDLTGKIALIVWNEGACNSSVFVANAAAAGAIGAVIIDNTDEPFTNFGGSAAIPSVAVGLPDGQLFIDTLDTDTVNATLEDNPDGMINRDSDLDAGVIAHEYGHGISNRLTGGPANSNCLPQGPTGDPNEQGGEGWSDWWTLSLFADAADTETTSRGVGNYVTFRPIDGSGIRSFPYNTDLGVNPQTYEDIGGATSPHGVGEVWAGMLWEMYWRLTDRDGFDADFYNGTGGNNLAIQLVVDGMKFQMCMPTLVDSRDAILAADLANYGGANACEIWNAFAKRGLGFSADAGSFIDVGDETEAFDLPPDTPTDCPVPIFFDGFESGSTSAWGFVVGES